MKKALIKIAVFIAVFVITVLVGIKVLNKGHNNLTIEMSKASLPVVIMNGQGYDYNRLFGYTEDMDCAMMWRNVTALGDNLEVGFCINTYGDTVNNISFEVRSCDSTRLIEKTEVSDFDTDGQNVTCKIFLKDLIEEDENYNLIIKLDVENIGIVNYYTKVIWQSENFLKEKIAFALNFHNLTFDSDNSKELSKYLEPNSNLEKNESYHNVNIHSSVKQVTWGDLNITDITSPVINVTDIEDQTADITLEYRLKTSGDKTTVAYFVTENYRVRYTAERMYLIDFDRTMSQIPDENTMCINDKIALGINDENVNLVENEDGSVVAFEEAGRLFAYNASTNKIAVLFGYYDEENQDERDYNNQHSIKILDVDESGNIWFGVYGYINRGNYEGRVGLKLYMYDESLNTIEELLYIDAKEEYSIVKADLDKLLYMNRSQEVYFYLNGRVYCANLNDYDCKEIIEVESDNTLEVSDNNKIICWQNQDNEYSSTILTIKNLSTGTEETVKAGEGEVIMPLGFMNEDVIYGIANVRDIVQEVTGAVTFPMGKICICNSEGDSLKEYSQEGIYILGIKMSDNQITLNRVTKDLDGNLVEIEDDQITNNTEITQGKNVVSSANIDVYERYIQIKTKSSIDTKNLQILTPKEMVFEGQIEVSVSDEEEKKCYYAFGPDGVINDYLSPVKAIELAYENNGKVIDKDGDCIWVKGNRLSKNQIMKITAQTLSEGQSSLSVCLNTILTYEGISRSTESELSEGKTAEEILTSNLSDCKVLDLTGSSLDSVLYYINRDLPVLVTLNNNQGVLITGFNEYNIVIMDPSSGELYKMGINDATKWLESNGNRFLTYTRVDS